MPPDQNQTTPQDPNSDIQINSQDDALAHVETLKQRAAKIAMKKTLGYRQLELLRKDLFQKFVGEMKQRGVDVSTPQKLQQFLTMLAPVDPDMAQYIAWMVGQLLPDLHEDQHMAGTGVADIAMQFPDQMGQPVPPMPGIGQPLDQGVPQAPEPAPEEAPPAAQ